MIDATFADVMRILNAHSVEVLDQLKLPARKVQLSMPYDERGPRIKVSVHDDANLRVPAQFSFDLDGRQVRVMLERSDDYQDYRIR